MGSLPDSAPLGAFCVPLFAAPLVPLLLVRGVACRPGNVATAPVVDGSTGVDPP